MSSTNIVEKKATENGTKIATECITNIRTVASLSNKRNRTFEEYK